MKNLFLILLCLIIPFISCTTEEREENPNCKKAVIINNDRFEAIDNSFYKINDAKIVGDCLNVSISAGGCDGETWKVDLVDAGRVAETLIVQRDLKISIKSSELCEAIVTKTYSFNLQPIQTSDKEIILNLENWEGQLRYEY